ncbi:MAG: hypothetical protein QS721_11645 [Candidatus Endonucleobacter sp. (ex Gigantidas childressi)]|nr:hypothetical protein [Candidatus Endonucleobacter sp. (ex Gigantidas childressi)]
MKCFKKIIRYITLLIFFTMANSLSSPFALGAPPLKASNQDGASEENIGIYDPSKKDIDGIEGMVAGMQISPRSGNTEKGIKRHRDDNIDSVSEGHFCKEKHLLETDDPHHLNTDIGERAVSDPATPNKKIKLSMSEEKSNAPVLLLDDDNNKASDGLLEYLEYYVTNEEKIILSNIANDQSYEAKFLYLKEEGPTSDSYINIDTYRTLYWALRNNKLSEWDFMEHNHCLSCSLMYRPDSKLYHDIASNVKTFKIEHSEKDGEEISYDNLNKARYCIEFHTGTEHDLCMDTTTIVSKYDNVYYNQRTGISRLRSILAWYADGLPISRNMLGTLCITKSRYSNTGLTALLDINSFAKTCFLLSPHSSVDVVDVRPTFSFGDINGLIELRRKNAHPLALFFPDIKSLEEPDDRWAGNLSYIHDFRHIRAMQALERKNRTFLLDVSELIIDPLLQYANKNTQSLNTKQLTESSEFHFLGKIKVLIENLPSKTKEHSNEKMARINNLLCNNKDWHKKLVKVKNRIVDQADPTMSYVHYGAPIMADALLCRLENKEFHFLLLNYILYFAFEKKNNNNVYELCNSLLHPNSCFDHEGDIDDNNSIDLENFNIIYKLWSDIYTQSTSNCY